MACEASVRGEAAAVITYDSTREFLQQRAASNAETFGGWGTMALGLGLAALGFFGMRTRRTMLRRMAGGAATIPA